MRFIEDTIVSLVAVVALAAPLTALAFIPVGGKVVAIHPCPPGIPGYVITVVGLGIGSGSFLVAPSTIPFMSGPALIGKWVLGTALGYDCAGPLIMTGTSPF